MDEPIQRYQDIIDKIKREKQALIPKEFSSLLDKLQNLSEVTGIDPHDIISEILQPTSSEKIGDIIITEHDLEKNPSEEEEFINIDYNDIHAEVIRQINNTILNWKRNTPEIPLCFNNSEYPGQVGETIKILQTLRLSTQELADMGLKYEGNKLILIPLNENSLLEYSGNVLVHQGYADSHSPGGFDNIQKLKRDGIWGDTEGFTYLAPASDTSVKPNFVFREDSDRRVPVKIYIDTKKLLKWRKVYLDPEQYMEKKNRGSIPKNAFIITGGIPAEVILFVSDKLI